MNACRLLLRYLICALAGVMTVGFTTGPALSDWTSMGSAASGVRAGYTEDKKSLDVLWFACSPARPGRLDLGITGFPRGLPMDVVYTVVVSVDGLAFVETMRPRPGGSGGAAPLVKSVPAKEFAPLIEAMAAGRKAEISTPAGRGTVSLKGAGKALAALRTGCR